MSYRSVSYGPAMAKLYAMPTLDRGSGHSPSPYYQVYTGDILFACYNSGAIEFGPRPIASLLQIGKLPHEDASQRDDTRTFKPIGSVYESATDWARYGSRFQSLNFMRQTDGSASLREHSVKHVKFDGDVEDDVSDELKLYDMSTSREINGFTIVGHTPRYVGHPITNVQATGFNTDGYLEFQFSNAIPGYQATEKPLCDYFEYVDLVVNAINTEDVVFNAGGGWHHVYTNASHNCRRVDDINFIDISYDYEQRWDNGYEYIDVMYHVHLQCSIAMVDSFGSNNPFDLLSIDPACFNVADASTVVATSYHYRRPVDGVDVYLPPDETISSIGSGVHVSIVVSSVHEFYSVGFLTVPLQKPAGAASNFMRYRQQGSSFSDRVWLHLDDGMDVFMPHLRPSSFYSSADALDSQIEVLTSNNVENLTQLGGILELLPSLGALPEVIAKAMRRDPSAIIDAIDFITDAVLKARFGQIPTAKDAAEIARTDIRKGLEDLLKTRYYTAYGIYHYTFSDEDNWVGHGDLVLTARSKIRFHIDLTTLLGTLLSLNGMGLLPTLERSWAVVPYSFVVDWFTNMSERLGAIDKQLQWLVLGCDWALHTYQVSYYPSDEELHSYGLIQTPGGRPFNIRAYRREFSRMLPRLADSKFDFLGRQRPPNAVTVASFAWQTLRK